MAQMGDAKSACVLEMEACPLSVTRIPTEASTCGDFVVKFTEVVAEAETVLSAPEIAEAAELSAQAEVAINQEVQPAYVDPPTGASIFRDHPADQRPWAQMNATAVVLYVDNPTTRNSAPSQYAEPFQEKNTRQKFIRNVFTTLFIQLIFTFLLVFYARQECEKNLKCVFSDVGYTLLATLGYMVFMLSLICVRKPPSIYFVAFGMTVCLAWCASSMTLRFPQEVVILAFVLTMLLTLLVTLIAICTSIDITAMSTMFYVFTIFTIILGFAAIITAIFFQIKWISVLYTYVFLILTLMYMMYFAQMIVGGRRYQFAEDDAVLAATLFYVEVVMLFMTVLRIIDFR